MFLAKHWKAMLSTLLTVAALALVWTGLTRQVAVGAALGTKMHISGIGVTYKSVGGPNRLPIAQVDIRDEFGNPVDGAVVTGDWSGCFVLTGASATTQTYPYADGRAQIYGDKHSCWGNNHCNFTFTVTSVTKSGMTYDASANVASSATTPCM
jgi:hypothetical protein